MYMYILNLIAYLMTNVQLLSVLESATLVA